MKGQQAQEQNKQWLINQVNHIFQPMMLKIVAEEPEDHLDYMIKYLEAEFDERATIGNPGELKSLKEQVKILEE